MPDPSRAESRDPETYLHVNDEVPNTPPFVGSTKAQSGASWRMRVGLGE